MGNNFLVVGIMTGIRHGKDLFKENAWPVAFGFFAWSCVFGIFGLICYGVYSFVRNLL